MVEREQPYHLRTQRLLLVAAATSRSASRPSKRPTRPRPRLYLESQRRRIQQLSSRDRPAARRPALARPASTSSRNTAASSTAGKASPRRLQAYEAKKPGGSLEALEKYLLVRAPADQPGELRPGGGAAAAGRRLLRRAARAEIQRALYLRCGDLRGELAASHWRRLAEQVAWREGPRWRAAGIAGAQRRRLRLAAREGDLQWPAEQATAPGFLAS